MIAFVQDPDVTFFCTGKFYEDRSYIFKAVNLKALDEGKSVNLWLQDLICKELEIEVEQELKLVRRAAGQVA